MHVLAMHLEPYAMLCRRILQLMEFATNTNSMRVDANGEEKA